MLGTDSPDIEATVVQQELLLRRCISFGPFMKGTVLNNLRLQFTNFPLIDRLIAQ